MCVCVVGGGQDTADSTSSSLQSSFQKEIERANTLRWEAAASNAQITSEHTERDEQETIGNEQENTDSS